jgi:NADPH:quinone reductase-like Zn-dependent oxidoreductase
MKAAILDHYGGLQSVRVGDFPRPVVKPEEVRVAVHAAGVNPIDWKLRSGSMRVLLPFKFPVILGSDFSGVIEEVGAKVKGWSVGDEVCGFKHAARGAFRGTFAESVAINVAEVARKPANVSHEQAGAIGVAGATAWRALVPVAKLQRGQRVLIHAAAGGVGTFAVQIAKTIGAEVAATCSTRNVDFVRQLGADMVIDYTRQRFEDAVRDCDVVLDAVGGEVQDRSWAVLKRGGTLAAVLTGAPKARNIIAAGAAFASENLRKKLRSLASHVRYVPILVGKGKGEVEEVAKLVAAGKVRVILDRVYPLEEVAQALAQSETGHARGKIVVKVR